MYRVIRKTRNAHQEADCREREEDGEHSRIKVYDRVEDG